MASLAGVQFDVSALQSFIRRGSGQPPKITNSGFETSKEVKAKTARETITSSTFALQIFNRTTNSGLTGEDPKDGERDGNGGSVRVSFVGID